MTNSYVTTLTKANTKSNSLRTTVPSSVRDHYGLKVGDKIDWHFDTKNDEIIVIVKPIKEENNGSR